VIKQLLPSAQKPAYFCILIFFNSIAVAEVITSVASITLNSGTSNGISSSAPNGRLTNDSTITMTNSSRGDGINSSGDSSVIKNNNEISIQSFGTLFGGRGGDGIDARGVESIVNNAEGASIRVGTNLLTRAGYVINLSGARSLLGNDGQISSGLGALGGININAPASSSIVRNAINGSVAHTGVNTSAISVNANNIVIDNAGSISAIGIAAHGVVNNSSEMRLINTGAILTQDSVPFIRNINQDIFGSFAVRNSGSIASLINAQGGDASESNRIALTYSGNLPTNYEVMVTDSTRYGQLFVRGRESSQMVFSINDQTDLRKGTYARVLVGVGANNLANQGGNYKGFSFQLINNESIDINSLAWDMIVTGAYTADTQQSLINTASVLQGTFTLQNTVMINGFTYDCPLFDKHGVCISAGGRNTTVQSQGINNTSGLLIASYRLDQNNSRIGAWVDQNLSVSGPGTVKLGNSMPMIGFFGVWSERPDGIGAEIKASVAYGQKDVTVTRSMVGTSEAGSGGSQLVTQGAQAIGKYGFALLPDTVVSPYAGVRYTQNNMGGYTEAATSAVTAPLTYSALNTNATTLLAGAEARYRGIPKTIILASAGVESDVRNDNDSYSATGISGLTPVNFNPNPVKTRPTATLGAYYDIVKNQRLGITGIYRQESYQAVSTTTVMATYTIGL
jgi:hypothetical protein